MPGLKQDLPGVLLVANTSSNTRQGGDPVQRVEVDSFGVQSFVPHAAA
jgi:hypothetical protein